MQAIETVWNGYRFRSRTEARWAVFFTSLGLTYDYEKEGFQLARNVHYLPDFYIQEWAIWIEIKGDMPTLREKNLCRRFQQQIAPIMLFWGNPWPEEHGAYCPQFAAIESMDYGNLGMVTLTQCRRCERGWYLRNDFSATPIEDCGDACQCERWPIESTLVHAAYVAARQARFEHGEKPMRF